MALYDTLKRMVDTGSLRSDYLDTYQKHSRKYPKVEEVPAFKAPPTDTRRVAYNDPNAETMRRQIGSSPVGLFMPNNDYRKEAEQRVAQNVINALTGGESLVPMGAGVHLYRGDSIHPDGVGLGTVGDLGKGKYFTDSPHVAEYFTESGNPKHIRKFDVDIKSPFDLMARDLPSDPRWQKMMNTLPPDPVIGPKPKQQLEKWARGETDVRNPYGFVARAFGKDVSTFNDFLAQHGYDSVKNSGIRGVSDGALEYAVFGDNIIPID